MSNPQENRYPANRYPPSDDSRSGRPNRIGDGADNENAGTNSSEANAQRGRPIGSPALSSSPFQRQTELLSTPPSGSPIQRFLQSNQLGSDPSSLSSSPVERSNSPRQFLGPNPPSTSIAAALHDQTNNDPVYGSDNEQARSYGVPAEEAERIVRRHLVQHLASDAEESASEDNASDGAEVPGSDAAGESELTNVHQLKGGAITHDVYKWAIDQERAQQARYRSKSLSGLPATQGGAGSHSAYVPIVGEDASLDNVTSLLQPGGFRRHFVARQAVERGQEQPNILTRNFIDFLALYGHFAGDTYPSDDEEEGEEYEDDYDEEDYDEDENQDVETGYGGISQARTSESIHDVQVIENEQTPLLLVKSRPISTGSHRLSGTSRRLSSTSRRLSGTSRHRRSVATNGSQASMTGTASIGKVFFLLIKSFVGTGVLFLPRSFYNGGMLFATVVLCFTSFLCLYTMLLLVECRSVIHGSFGEIGGILFGTKARRAVQVSIVISQFGFSCAYTIFVARNLRDLAMLVSDCNWIIPEHYLILAQLAFSIPMSMVRKIKHLSSAALIADVFIVFGLCYLYYYDISILVTSGVAPIRQFNPADFTLFIGTAIFTFEGIGLVVPIVESMKEPHRFPKVLSGTMLLVTIIFISIGALSYAAFGENVETVVLLNLPSGSVAVEAVQLFYSLAILFSIPLQMFPPIRILEATLFAGSGKGDPFVKWQKNLLRLLFAVSIAAVSWLGASNLDRFVSLIGSFACIPLSFIYPAMFHYKALAHTSRQRVIDILLAVFGFIVMIYVTFTTVSNWITDENGEPENNRCQVVPP